MDECACLLASSSSARQREQEVHDAGISDGNGWGRALPPGSFDPAATIEKKDPLPQRGHGSLYRLIRVTCFLSSPTRRRLWMVEKNPRASSAERAKRSDKHGQNKAS